MITRIEKVTLYVGSQEEAKKFWIEKMGFVLALEQQMGPDMKWVEVAPKGENLTTMVLYSKKAMQQQNPGMVAHPSMIFGTDDIASLWKTIKGRGVEVTEIQSLPYGKMFSFKDNDGNPYMVRG